MAMKIQKGNVKYKDRNDIVCTYGIVDDGTQYYFMDSSDTKKFSNGNRIATTLLVEAVDPMVKTNNIGLIDSDGNVVIPFENKSIRPVNDNIIIVESAVPTTQSVIDAINLRNDPLAATKLVSTPATIKEKLNKQMGVEGRYLFNDQFSEATICDINGNNLVNNEKYSFIAFANDKLYLSKNTLDSTIDEFAVASASMQEGVNPSATEGEINVEDVKVGQEVIDNAMDNSVKEENSVPQSLGEDIPVTKLDSDVEKADNPSEALPTADNSNEAVGVVTENVPETPKAEESMENMTSNTEGTLGFEQAVPPIVPEGNEIGVTEETPVDTQNVVDTADEAPAEAQDVVDTADEVPAETQDVVDTAAAAPAEAQDVVDTVNEAPAETQDVVDTADEAPAETQDVVDTADEAPAETQDVVDTADEAPAETHDEVAEDTLINNNDELLDEQLSDVVLSNDTNINDDKEMENISDNIVPAEETFIDSSPERQLSSLFNNEENVFENSMVKPDKIVKNDDYYSQVGSFDVGGLGIHTGDTIMTDVARSMQELISQNRTQKGLISQYKSKVDAYESQARVMTERYNEQVNRNELLSEKLRELSSSATRLDSRNKMLDGKVRELEKIATSQDRELNVLRSQLEGKQDLVKLLADAKVLLGAEDTYNYDDEASYYRRAA